MVYLWLAKNLAGPLIRSAIALGVTSVVLDAFGITLYDVADCFGLLGGFVGQYGSCPV
jgi:hypothetical protein